MHAITILAADSIDSCRLSLETSILQNREKFKFLQGCSHAQEVLEATKAHLPQLVVMDVDLPGMCTLELCGRLLQQSPTTHVIARTTDDVVYHTRRMLKAGASGLLHRDAPLAEMAHCFTRVHEGHLHVPKSCTHLQKHKFGDGKELSEFDQKVLRLLCQRRSLNEIAELLFASLSRVRRAKERINVLAGCHDIAGIMRWACLQGYVSLKECWGW